MKGQPSQASPRFTWLFIVAACAAALGKIALASRDVYWSDEMTSLFYAKQPGWSALLWDNSPPLFYIFLRLWVQVAQSEFAIKLLPVFFSITTPWVLFLCARRFWSPRIANFALVTLSFHAVSFYYATEVRTYSLAELLGVIQLFFFFESRERRKLTLDYHLASTALVLSHYLGLMFILAQLPGLFVACAPSGCSSPRSRRLSRSQIQILAEGTLLIALSFEVTRHISFHSLEFLKTPDLKAVFAAPAVLFYNLCAHSKVAASLLFAIFLWKWRAIRPLGQILIMCLMSAAVIALVTGYAPTPERYYIFLIPTICLSFAIALDQLTNRFLRALPLAVGALAFTVLSVRHFTQEISRAGWKVASQRIAPQNSNLVVLFGHQGLKDPYFSHHRTVAVPIESPPDFLVSGERIKDVWLVFPEANREVPVIGQVQSYLEERHYAVTQWGVFAPQASQPVGYVHYSRPGAD